MNCRKLLIAWLTLVLSAPCALADEPLPTNPLQGSVEETGIMPTQAEPTNDDIMDMPIPVLPEVQKKPLEATIRKDALHGDAEQEDLDLKEGRGLSDDQQTPLRGQIQTEDPNSLAQQDPDMDDKELQVLWDKWRNKFLRSVQQSVQEHLNNPEDENLRFDPARNAVVMRFPLGTTCWFYCKIDNNRHIVSLKVMESSKFPGYDRAVMEAVRSLEGSSILRFPPHSKRPFVTQSAGIKTSDSGSQEYFHFGDVERYRTQP